MEANNVSTPLAQSGTPAPAPAVKLTKTQEILSAAKSLVTLIVLAVLLRGTVVEAFKIPSSSMVPTLLIGDHILVNKLAYKLGFSLLSVDQTFWLYGTPSRGDIVVFTLPDDPSTPDVDESQTNLIKRVIGLPGDRVEVRGTNVYLNGRIYQEDDRYARWLGGGTKDFGPVTVPAGRVLLLGDNRDYSRDARYWPDPFLEISRIKGRAFFIYWSSVDPLQRMFRAVR